MRSSKMKTELISNVSHDLKTPLTTLISYIDLLQKENITDEERQHYIQILDNSSLRLKRCIDDLFEISKVESGNVQCNLVEVNLSDLLKQIHFEMSDKIEASNLTFKTSYPEQKIICMLDSPKTYRIFDNLYMNIFKYAMPYTRVYIELKEENGFAVVSFKNVSATEITYAPDELTERCLLYTSRSSKLDSIQEWHIFLVFVNAVNTAIAVYWEFYEYAMLIFFNNDAINHYTSGVHDTITDMLVCVAGGLVVTGFLISAKRSGKDNFFTRLPQKFYDLNLAHRNG